MKEYDRTERIAVELQRDLAEILSQEVKDPRLMLSRFRRFG